MILEGVKSIYDRFYVFEIKLQEIDVRGLRINEGKNEKFGLRKI